MNRSDKERLKKILALWKELSIYMSENNITEDRILSNDKHCQWTITTPIYNIGEQVYKLTPELKNKYPELPWSKVSGLRHRLVHEYEETNWNVISDIIFNRMEEFIASIQEILKTM